MEFKDILDVIEKSTGVTIDTRTMSKGNVFFAISGENFDGNSFVDIALKNGAVLVISSDKIYCEKENVVVVDDVLKTMQELARRYRRRFDIPLIAVTGTNGKTTTKELLCSILQGKFETLCTKGNFNNHIGVPLTLFSLSENHQIGIVEMGASSLGEIRFLCEIAEPNFGVITSIGKAHIEGFGSFENIVKTKLELYNYLKDNNGKFFYNESVTEISEHLKCIDNDCIEKFSQYKLEGISFSTIEMKKTFPYISMNFYLNTGEIKDVSTMLYGGYNFNNIVTSVKISDYFGVEGEVIMKRLGKYIPRNNRSQILKWNSNTIILDAYNANPTSMKEALKSFIDIETGMNKYLILGDMLELGKISLNEHKNIIRFIYENNKFDIVILIGNEFKKAKQDLNQDATIFQYYNNSTEVKKALFHMNITNSLVLAKGSRGIRIESIFS